MRVIHRSAALGAAALFSLAALVGCAAGGSEASESASASAAPSGSASSSTSTEPSGEPSGEPTGEPSQSAPGDAGGAPSAEACEAAYVELEAINDRVDEITAEMSNGDMSRSDELYDAMISALDGAETALDHPAASDLFDSMRDGVEGMRSASEGVSSIDELEDDEAFLSGSDRLDAGGAELGELCA